MSGSLDTTIRVWDIKAGVALHNLIGHQSLTSGMQLRGNILVSGNADASVKVGLEGGKLWEVVCLSYRGEDPGIQRLLSQSESMHIPTHHCIFLFGIATPVI